MTVEVSVEEAEARLSELLSRAEAGEEVVILRRGKPVARIVAVEREGDSREAVRAIRAMRERVGPLSVAELMDFKQAGRRF